METHFRSILKAVSWRIGGTVVTVTVAWFLTKSFDLAAQIGIFDTAIKIGVFYAHERFWNRLNFGKIERPEYEI